MATELRFVVDVNVGRLAKWLRVMGYDTLFPREGNDNDLVRIALREGRVLITRDAEISLRRSVRQGQMRVVQILHDDLRSQLRQLVMDLKLDLESGFSRCVRCNDLLNSVERDSVADRLPSLRVPEPQQVHGMSPLPAAVLAGHPLVGNDGPVGPNLPRGKMMRRAAFRLR